MLGEEGIDNCNELLTVKDAQSQVEQIEEVLRSRAAEGLLQFLDVITIPSASGPQRLRDCITDFQRASFEALAPAIHAVRDGRKPSRRRYWVERTKKAGKDSDLAICLLWLMAFSVRPVLVQVCAANQKQASIIKRRIEDLLYYNPWLHTRVRVVLNKIVSKNVGEVVIEATGTSGGAQGETPDLLVLNELVHVDRWSVMETHMNNADGVPRGVVVISTNAGFRGTPAWKWRENALADPNRWDMHVWGKAAPWADQKDMDDAKKRNKGSEYRRLWEGEWVSGRGDALSEGVIDRCFDNDLAELNEPQQGWRYVGGLDLGVSHDHCGLVILGVNTLERKIRLAWMRSWSPRMETLEGKVEVDLVEVEKQVLIHTRLFRVEWMGYDPSQAKLMAQRLLHQQVPMREMTFSSSKNMTTMADALIQVVEGGTLECYDDADGTLRRDFGKFDLVERAAGMKLEAVSDEYGHADVGTALVICLPKALDMLGGRRGGVSPEDDVAWNEEVSLSEEEVAAMPSELREIYEMGDYRPRDSIVNLRGDPYRNLGEE